MKEIVEIVEEIIRDNVNDLPLEQIVSDDKVILDKNFRFYKKSTTISIPKHGVEITQITKEHYKGNFAVEKRYDTSYSFFIRYNDEVIPITENIFYVLDELWYNMTHNKQEKQLLWEQ